MIVYQPKSISDRLFPKSKQRSPLITHKTRSPISQIKTAIASHHPQNPIAYSLSNQTAIAPSSYTKPDRLFPSNQTAIAPSSPTKPDRLNLNIKQRSPNSEC